MIDGGSTVYRGDRKREKTLPHPPPWLAIMPRADLRTSSYLRRLGAMLLQLRARPLWQ